MIAVAVAAVTFVALFAIGGGTRPLSAPAPADTGAGDAAPECEGVVGEYGCYDSEWCYGQWEGILYSVAADIAEFGRGFGMDEGLARSAQIDYPAGATELILHADAAVVFATEAGGESEGQREARSQANALCSDPLVLRSTIDIQLEVGG